MIAGLADRLGRAGHVVNIRHLKPRMVAAWRGQAEFVVVDPHGKPPRGAVLSLMKILAWLMEEWYFSLFQEKQETLLLCDRYYHDILVDPKRYRFGAPSWMAKLIGCLMPRPKLWILLDASPEVLRARKQEVSWQESSRQCHAYRDFIRERNPFAIVDASAPLDHVIAEAERAIAETIIRHEHNET